MKYRTKLSKLKREHAIIPRLQSCLEELANWPEIDAIIPGVIRPIRSKSNSVRLEIKYQTATGLKALAKSGSAVQEVFFVCNDKDLLEQKLTDYLESKSA